MNLKITQRGNPVSELLGNLYIFKMLLKWSVGDILVLCPLTVCFCPLCVNSVLQTKQQNCLKLVKKVQGICTHSLSEIIGFFLFFFLSVRSFSPCFHCISFCCAHECVETLCGLVWNSVLGRRHGEPHYVLHLLAG